MGDLRVDLPELQWRGLAPVPALCQPWSFSHSQPQRRYPYIDDAGHDWTGREPIQMPVVLYFNSPLIADPFGEWIKWRKALLDGSPGDLIHPTVGEVRAVVLSGVADQEPTARNNFAVSVTFETHIDDPEKANDLNNQDLTILQQAEAAEAAAAEYNITWPDGTFSDSLGESIAQIEGAVSGVAQDVGAVANQVAGVVSTMADAAAVLTDPLSYPAFDGLVRTWGKVSSAAERLARTTRSTSSRTLANDSTIDAFANSVGNTPQEIQSLNPAALRFPYVKKGTTLVYYV